MGKGASQQAEAAGKSVGSKSLTTCCQNDPVKNVLCEVFCTARNEWHDCKDKKPPIKCTRPSRRAEQMLDEDKWKRKLGKALKDSKRYPKGTKFFPEKKIIVPYNKEIPKGKNGKPKWKRTPLSPDKIKKALEPVSKKLIATIKKKLGQKLVKKAATAWMKFVPILNVISTAYDIYDIAATGYDLYKAVDEAMSKYKGKVFQVRPDVVIEGPDGKLEDIYDFKFDDPETKYQDDWSKNPGQKELYDEALGGDNSKKKAKKISKKECDCRDSKRDIRAK
ncbi:hypothetical protein PN36_33870 [Candidatus Thiomargarita nelsonii]|uniref:Uncharacterized protein n=1 Tax=Candidatus Thiomargarita nelsonii TaxID=1003181 RepID=A0A0A6PDP7_9GAMM|nr:hypothetical protein PN36_33870 [Candidatus Thiomargarita nelsonii]